jgi:hypothetical protein
MKIKDRWIKSIVSQSKDLSVSMPWERGSRRKAFIARRSGTSGRDSSARA